VGVARFQSRMMGASAVYKCGACGKQTRETGQDESSCELCAYCYLVFTLDNSLNDGVIDDAEFSSQLAELQREYGRSDLPWE